MLAAQYDLGTLYTTGTGVDPNAFEAAKWIGKAAAAGYTEAQVDYAVMLFRGQACRPTRSAAPSCSARPPRRGCRGAEPVGALLRPRRRRGDEPGRGRQVASDRQGRRRSPTSLDKILTKLSKADRAKAEKAADEWRDRMQVGIE